MRIQEVEPLTGITKKNIRFYEQEGLLHPRRLSEPTATGIIRTQRYYCYGRSGSCVSWASPWKRSVGCRLVR